MMPRSEAENLLKALKAEREARKQYERELKDTAKAITTYQRVTEFDPDDLQAIQRLDVLYAEAE